MIEWWDVGGEGEEDGCQKSVHPCWRVCMQHWLCSKRWREREGWRQIFLLCWAGLGALLTVLDWWIELCIAHNIDSVPIPLSFLAALSHHSSLSFPSPAFPFSLSVSPPAVTAPGPSLVPPVHISFQKASVRERVVRQQESEASRFLSMWQFSCLASCMWARELDWTVVFRGGGRRGGKETGGRTKRQSGQMEDSTQHLGHCIVGMKELSVNPEGLTAAGELTAPCCLSLLDLSAVRPCTVHGVTTSL